jgi:SAM-dependent methyltransferase
MKQQGQAFDTDQFYDRISKERFMEIAEQTGLVKEGKSLDAGLLVKLVERARLGRRKVLEVGCGFGRVGKYFLNREGFDYVGVDVYVPYVEEFRRSVSERERGNILQGSFLDSMLLLGRFDAILFPWSTIAEFSREGQIVALQKLHGLLEDEGQVLIDVPVDVANKFECYEPGPLNVCEVHDFQALGLQHYRSHTYTTHTGRTRDIIELRKI